MTLGVGPVKGRYRADVKLSDLDPPHAVTLGGSAEGALGFGSGEGRITLVRSADGGTAIRYVYEAAIGGKVASIGGRLLDGAARVIIGQFFAALARQAGGGAAGHSASFLACEAASPVWRAAMKPAAFDYVRAEHLDEALDVLGREGGDARIIAGGQSLMAMLNMRLARPRTLIDIMRLAELGRIESTGGTVRIGAAVRQDFAARMAGPCPPFAVGRAGAAVDRSCPDPKPRHHLRLDRACRPQCRAAAGAAGARRRGASAQRQPAPAGERRRISLPG